MLSINAIFVALFIGCIGYLIGQSSYGTKRKLNAIYYKYDTPIEDVEAFVGLENIFPNYLDLNLERIEMYHLKTKFGILTLHTNTWIVKSNSGDLFIMDEDTYKEFS